MHELLKSLGIAQLNHGTSTGLKSWSSGDTVIDSFSPVDAELIAQVYQTTQEDYELVLSKAQNAAIEWRNIPAPKRGEIVRQMGEAFRKHKENLGKLVSYEMGKSLQEGLGEVQEIIDICDFAVGLSRQLYGLTMHSSDPHIVCMSNGIHLGLLVLSLLLTFL
jgi:aldehyde dehydrogenase (NAD+)